PGITMLSVRRRAVGRGYRKFNQGFGMLLALDAEGEVIWYYRVNSRISDIERLRNGNLIYLTKDYRAVEIDLLGNVITSWYAAGRPEGPDMNSIPVDTTTFHHEIKELPSGNFIVLGTELRLIDNYYTSETEPNAPRKTQKVMGDKIIEFQRDGKIVWQWNAFEHLDVFRIGYLALNDYWSMRGFLNTTDWTHANGISYNKQDNSLLISMRKQDAILKIDRASKEIQWILGEPSDWSVKLQSKLLKPIGNMRWFYHQHSPKLTSQNTIILFDNGIFQARPFNPPISPAKIYSRAIKYAIDEKNMTVREIWSSEEFNQSPVISFAMGDVDWLPKTNNILVSYGFLMPHDKIDKIKATWGNLLQFRAWTRTREYTHTNPPELAWEVIMEDNSKEKPTGWIIFGAERIPSLHNSIALKE
ncbi:MAG: aryl-sulfate sulfotransferase, partial [Thiomargarita sp.]|nr:aryl-sulfate sulfotransferase [Thiomargarita sp.]